MLYEREESKFEKHIEVSAISEPSSEDATLPVSDQGIKTKTTQKQPFER